MSSLFRDSKIKTYQLVSLVAFFVGSIFSIGFFQSDEHFQILEYASLKLGRIDATNMPWEYTHQMRSAFQPLLVVWLHRILEAAGMTNPFFTTAILRLCSAALTFYSMYLVYQAYCRKYDDPWLRKWFSYLSFLLWCAIFVGIRFSSESWSGSLIVIGFSWYFLGSKNPRTFFLMGFFFGLAYLCRFQVSLMVFGFVAWLAMIKKESWANLLILGCAILLAMGLGIGIDRWYYDDWTWTFWHYIDQNIIQDKVSTFGVDPWWDYLLQIILVLVPPFSLIPLFCFGYLMIRRTRHELVWICLPFILAHFVIGHKELRFLFPLIGFLPAMIIEGLRSYQLEHGKAIFSDKYGRVFTHSFAFINAALLLFVCITPLDRTTPLYRFIYGEYQGPTTLYYIENDPFKEGHLTYYKRPNLTITKIDHIEDIPERSIGIQLFVTEQPESIRSDAHMLEERYKTMPRWIFYLNYNGWIERTHVWYLYEKQ